VKLGMKDRAMTFILTVEGMNHNMTLNFALPHMHTQRLTDLNRSQCEMNDRTTQVGVPVTSSKRGQIIRF
jgi:hypothetical protein